MKPPILICTPRSGSTAILNDLHEISAKLYDSRNSLNEYFTCTSSTRFPVKHKIYKNKAGLHVQQFKSDEVLDEASRKKEVLRRLNLLQSDKNIYTLKLFTSSIAGNNQIIDYIKQNYTPIFLQRRNKLAQFFSILLFAYNMSDESEFKKAHYHMSDKPPTGFYYRRDIFDLFYEKIEEYFEVKSIFENHITLEYSEWQNDRNILFDKLGLDESHKFKLSDFDKQKTIPVPYGTKNREELIINKDEWEADKKYVLGWLNTLP